MIVVVAGINGICWVGRMVELREAGEGIMMGNMRVMGL